MLEISWYILCDTAVYVLAGFAIAGLLQAWLAGGRAIRWLSQRSPRSVFLATMIGVPLPLCSCGVLPSAVTLRKSGASKGATLSFLISTPETSATSILLTYSLLGPLLAIFRPVAACVTALTAGFIENFFDRREAAQQADQESATRADETCCRADSQVPSAASNGRGLRAGMRFAFVDLFDDIFFWVVVGIVAAAAIQAFVPVGVFQTVFGDAFTSMLLMLVIGIPLYICAESSTPIAAALIAQGMNPGAALVLLLAGPATNIGAVGVLYRELGRRTIIVYLITIAIVTLLMGGLLNLLIGETTLSLGVRAFNEPLVPSWLKIAGAITFLVLGVLTMRRRHWWSRSLAWLDARLPVPVTPRSVLTTGCVVLVLGYVGSGFVMVQPGEVAVVRRFGAIARSDLKPGLHYAWPYPIETADRIPVRRVNRLLLGLALGEDPTSGSQADVADSWTLIGDENIADLKTAVQWGAVPEEVLQFAYGIADREGLVRDVTLGAIREVLGGRTINRGFTTERRDCEALIEALIRQRLASYNSGIRVDSFHFLDAHAPPEVHDAFRDVASALEDKSTQINLALAQEARVVPLARGDAVGRSQGETQRFVDLLEEYQHWPEVTRRRLYFETIDAVLPGLHKYVKPGGDDAGEIEIWLVNPRVGGGLPWQPDTEMR
jgi:uncharacterized membrane protein YraQ (UPF0718 family)/regulator of protease activity HflC (stomatin/prohibitin superfamily)